MYKVYTEPYHQLAKVELTYKFLFFLRDLGLKSADQPSKEMWVTYMHMLVSLTNAG